MKRLVILAVVLFTGWPALADDNATAYRLFAQGRYAEAAELFTDPAWKGAALYNSGQWWRAAEAFVRSSDTVSLYNLGNSYVMLGYHELALETYLAVLKIDPGFKDASANADLMRRFLASKDDQRRGGLQPNAREIDRVKDENKDKKGGADPSSTPNDKQGKRNGKRQSGEGKKPDSEGAKTDSGGSGDKGAGKQDGADRQTGSKIRGVTGKDRGAQVTTGASGDGEAADYSQTASMRVRLEQAQATRQWLNAIKDDPARFLQKRIAQEMRRRAAAGTLPETKEDAR